MIQILTYLLCVYLVFKGVEIFQIALMSARASRAAGLVIGVIAIVGSIAAAAHFTNWIDQQARSVSSSSNPR